MPLKIADTFVREHLMAFPNPENADAEGLLAYGGDLNPTFLLSAYAQGIFPWFNSDKDEILWWSPDPRMVLFPERFKVSKSLKQTLRSGKFEVSVNQCFEKVILKCARIKRQGQAGTWITKNMQQAYNNLHSLGYAHSIETHYNQELVGGLYGVSIGKAFFGESMFHEMTDASKVALNTLVEICKLHDIHFIDVQQSTPHLRSLGADDIGRQSFLEKLAVALKEPSVLKNAFVK